MKSKVLSIVLGALMVGSLTAMAGNKTEKFKVYGNCGSCENRIEKAAESVDGVISADWNKETKIIEINFDDSKTNIDKIQKAIADAGHDTDKYKASDKTYNELPVCCQYDRSDEGKEISKDE